MSTQSTPVLLAVLATAGMSTFAGAQGSLILPDVPAGGAAEAPSTARCWPFFPAPFRYLTLYDADNFTRAGVSGPIDIQSLRWRANGGATSSPLTLDDVTLRVGPAAAPASGASLRFDANFLGGQPLAAFEGSVAVAAAAGTTPNNFPIDITLTNPVRYDPALGAGLAIDLQYDPPPPWTFSNNGMPSFDGFRRFGGGASGAGSIQFSSRDPLPETGLYEPATGPVIEVVYVPASGPHVDFRFTPQSAAPGLAVQFRDLSTTTDPGGIVAWQWDFDSNGAVDSTSRNPSWIAPSCSTSTVTLTVWDASGGTQTRVNAGPSIDAPIASFDVALTPQTSVAPVTVAFTDTSTNAPTSWAWDFDEDGIVDSTGRNPTWTYTTPGVYRPTLTASNVCGSSTFESTQPIRAVTSPPRLHTAIADTSFLLSRCPASAPVTLTPSGPPLEGEPAALFLGNLPSDATAGAVLFGARELELPLDALGAPGCALLLDPLFSVPVSISVPVPQLTWLAPRVTSLDGVEFHWQGSVLAPSFNALGAAFSERVTTVIGTDPVSIPDPRTLPGVVVHFLGNLPRSFSGGPTYFNFYNNSTRGERILRIVVDFADGGPMVANGNAEFDVVNTTGSGYGYFEYGNAATLDPSCPQPNAYFGTDVTTGLVYPGTRAAACGAALAATTGWIGTNPGRVPGSVRTLEFLFSSFDPGEAFGFNCRNLGDPSSVINGLNQCQVTIETDQRFLTGQLVQYRPQPGTTGAVQVW